MMTLNTCHPQIGLYFAWLGFYNQMLVFPALFGLFVFLFGAVTVNSSSINYAGYISRYLNIYNSPLHPVMQTSLDNTQYIGK